MHGARSDGEGLHLARARGPWPWAWRPLCGVTVHPRAERVPRSCQGSSEGSQPGRAVPSICALSPAAAPCSDLGCPGARLPGAGRRGRASGAQGGKEVTKQADTEHPAILLGCFIQIIYNNCPMFLAKSARGTVVAPD